MAEKIKKKSNFIRSIVEQDIKNNKNDKRLQFRFPPEPNGFLHIGHAKAVCLNFGLSEEFNVTCNLRMDDTNPVKEDIKYINAIKEDIEWLGFNWGDEILYTSDYFELLYQFAIKLIKKDKAFICELNAQEMKEYRGTLTQKGKNSPYRNRPVEESLKIFQEMREGKHEVGKYTLRAKIDMESSNLNMRDPIIYRITNTDHHRTKDAWPIYPMYDFAHPLSDAIEGITHSLCTLEFEDHRPVYDWFIKEVETEYVPRQIEFARLDLNYTIMSKRLLKRLVDENIVEGWDDPRMPTIAGLRRRGYTPDSIRTFAEMIGISKNNSTVDIALLEHFLREDLNLKAKRVMVVVDPIKLIIDNYPEDSEDVFEVDNNPENKEQGKRKITFSKEIFIERDDFMEDAPSNFFRLTVGSEVRLVNAYYVTCTHIVKDEDGNITEIHATYDPETRTGWFPGIRKVKGTIHWVDAKNAVDLEVNLYDNLFTAENPGKETGDFLDDINPNSLTKFVAKCESSLRNAKPQEKFQFLRTGYFNVDHKNFIENNPVFNRTVSLKSSYRPK
jgi:glutaminyl-tRNA synthetase